MMNARRLVAIAALLLPLVAPGAASADTIVPSGRKMSESRQVAGFTGVAYSLPGTLVLRQGPAAPVMVEADDNLMAEIETIVEAGTLKVRFRRNIDVRGRTAIQVRVTTPEIASLAVAGSGDALCEALKSESLKLATSGSGNVRIEKLEAGSLAASLAGSGSLRLAGQADEVTAKIAGSGSLEAGKLQSRRARLSIAGSGDATLWVSEALDTAIAGSGSVRYYGDPDVKKTIAGSGTLKRAGPAP